MKMKDKEYITPPPPPPHDGWSTSPHNHLTRRFVSRTYLFEDENIMMHRYKYLSRERVFAFCMRALGRGAAGVWRPGTARYVKNVSLLAKCLTFARSHKILINVNVQCPTPTHTPAVKCHERRLASKASTVIPIKETNGASE